MYRPEFEGDACGVGLVAATDGTPSRRVVSAAIDALKAVWHRGAVDADGKTGDGAGIHVDLPRASSTMRSRLGPQAAPNRLAVGMIFLPRTDLGAQEDCRTIVESEIIDFGYTIYGWRQVPVDVSVIGDKAQADAPEIEQIMIAGPLPDDESAAEFEKKLYLVRRRIEKKLIEAQIQGFYICSLSCRSIIYKGLFLAESLSVFYPDLLDERFESRVAIFHQRYSTNTFPQWWLAQPFRCLAHNGEINTIRGNKNWMKSHEIKMAEPGVRRAFGGHQAGDPGGRVRHRRARRRVRGDLPLGPRCADRQADAGARGLGRRATCPSRSRHVQLSRERDGAVGRPGRAGDDRRPLGRGRRRPQRAAPAALYAAHRRTIC
jgi:glutamate synthase (NADPH/NADH) large chain